MKIETYQALSTRRAQLPSLLPVRGHQAACVTDARRNNPAVVAFDFWRAFFAPQPVRADLPRGSSNPAGFFLWAPGASPAAISRLAAGDCQAGLPCPRPRFVPRP